MGKMGKFLYVEVGSRCSGGPGLVWIYFGSKERAMMMKDIFNVCKSFMVRCHLSEEPPLSQSTLLYSPKQTTNESLYSANPQCTQLLRVR